MVECCDEVTRDGRLVGVVSRVRANSGPQTVRRQAYQRTVTHSQQVFASVAVCAALHTPATFIHLLFTRATLC